MLKLYIIAIVFITQAQYSECFIGGFISKITSKFKEHVVDPVVTHVVKPVVKHVVDPVVKHVVKPVVKHVVDPVVKHVIKPVVNKIKEHVVDPIYKHVIQPIYKHVIQPIAEPLLRTMACIAQVEDKVAKLTGGRSSGGSCIRLNDCSPTSVSCSITVGGEKSQCMGVSKNLEYTRVVTKDPMTLTLQGSITASVWTQVKVRVGLGRFDATVDIGGRVGMHASIKFDVSRTASRVFNKRYVLAPRRQILRKMYMAGAVPVIIIVSVQPVANVNLIAEAHASGTLSFTYNNPRALEITDIKLGIENGRVITPRPSLRIKFHKKIEAMLNIHGYTKVSGMVNIGPEIIVDVNGVPFTFYPSIHASLGASVTYTNTNGRSCLQGLLTGGVGLDLGTSAPIPDVTPSGVMDKGCMAGVAAACMMRKNPAFLSANIAMCLAETISNKDLCGGGGTELCGKLSKEVGKALPLKLPTVPMLLKTILSVSPTVLKSIKTGRCDGVAPPPPVDAGVRTTSACSVRTTGGTAGGKCCMFPFSYKGKIYTSCTADHHTETWCFTAPNRKLWGNCVVSESEKPWRADVRCGSRYRLPSGKPAECNPNGGHPCCSKWGWCGRTNAHCKCRGCVDYRRRGDTITEVEEILEMDELARKKMSLFEDEDLMKLNGSITSMKDEADDVSTEDMGTVADINDNLDDYIELWNDEVWDAPEDDKNAVLNTESDRAVKDENDFTPDVDQDTQSSISEQDQYTIADNERRIETKTNVKSDVETETNGKKDTESKTEEEKNVEAEINLKEDTEYEGEEKKGCRNRGQC